MSILVIALLGKNKKDLVRFLEDCVNLGYKSNRNIKRINCYYIGYISKEFSYYQESEEKLNWIFKVVKLIEDKYKRFEYKYCLYTDDYVVNTDIDCEYVGVKYRLYKSYSLGSSASFCATLNDVKIRLYDFLKDCKIDYNKEELDNLTVDFESISKFCRKYEVDFVEVFHQYPNIEDFDASYKAWKNYEVELKLEAEEDNQYEGEWYDAYEVKMELEKIDSVLEYLEHHYRHSEEMLDDVKKCRELTNKIKGKYIYD